MLMIWRLRLGLVMSGRLRREDGVFGYGIDINARSIMKLMNLKKLHCTSTSIKVNFRREVDK